MASRHKTLWKVLGVGELKCLKKDPHETELRVPNGEDRPGALAQNGTVGYVLCVTTPSKTSFWIFLYFSVGVRKGCFAGKYELRQIPLWLLEAKIKEFAEFVENKSYFTPELEQALDYLFAELGRRANRKVIS